MGSVFGRDTTEKKTTDENITYMGKNVEIKGDIYFQGSGRIDGKVEGKITVKGSVILGEGSVIFSSIEGDTIIVGGRVQGKITAREKIHLLRTSSFTGDLITPSLLIEEGAQFNGSSKTTQQAVLSTLPNHSREANLSDKTESEQTSFPSVSNWQAKSQRAGK